MITKSDNTILNRYSGVLRELGTDRLFLGTNILTYNGEHLSIYEIIACERSRIFRYSKKELTNLYICKRIMHSCN